MAYQKKTIRKAPEHVRPLMRVANELDVQLRRLIRSIAQQVEMAELYHEEQSHVRGLQAALDLANRDPSKPDQLNPPPPLEDVVELDEFGNPIPIDEGLEDMSDFRVQNSSNGTWDRCLCYLEAFSRDGNQSDAQRTLRENLWCDAHKVGTSVDIDRDETFRHLFGEPQQIADGIELYHPSSPDEDD